MKTQAQEILRYMRKNGGITQAEAASKLGCYRLAARIYDLRGEGHDIVSFTASETSARTGRSINFARYSLR